MDVKHIVFITHPGYAIQDKITIESQTHGEILDYSKNIPEAKEFFETKILAYLKEEVKKEGSVFIFLFSPKFTDFRTTFYKGTTSWDNLKLVKKSKSEKCLVLKNK